MRPGRNQAGAATGKLAPYAVHTETSRGRVHVESTESGDCPFEGDRRRILSCAAFRRLQFKAQVFTDQRHDHFRTRLTHTLEVADIARRLAAALQANERPTECIALAHDLGHPPFGHAGERALDAAMAGHGGFEHNTRSLRVVDFLEHPYPTHRGLNLTFEVREGLLTHHTRYDRAYSMDSSPVGSTELPIAGRFPSVESQIASIADRIAYDGHDIEDALGAGILGEPELMDVSLWREASAEWRIDHPSSPLAALRRPILDRLVARCVADVAAESTARLQRLNPKNVDAVRSANEPVVAFSESFGAAVAELESFLQDRIYRHPNIVDADQAAATIVGHVFDKFVRQPERMPGRFAARVSDQGLHPVICDYVAGMTDRFCRDEHARWIGDESPPQLPA
ncbi:MAG: dNTP triphosphohydrolase [Phycisphaerales bacterium]|nr:dNTP triphosphohydrolase [Phycisphaerales bacterium]